MRMLLKIIFIFLFATPCYATDWTQSANCQGAWLLDINESPQTDSSGHDKTGTVDGATFNAIGQRGGCYDFDGANDEIDFGDNFEALNFSIVAYIKPNAPANWSMPISKFSSTGTNTWFLQMDDSTPKKIRFGVYQSDNALVVTTPNAITDGSWNHIVGTCDGTNVRLWVGGVNVQTNSTLNGTIDSNTASFKFGENTINGSDWKGSLDEVAYFDSTLDSTDINDIMDNGLVGGAPPTGNPQVIIISG